GGDAGGEGRQNRNVCWKAAPKLGGCPQGEKSFGGRAPRPRGGGVPPQAQPLQRSVFPRRSQKAAGRNIHHTIDKHRLMIVWTADRQIAVGQAGCAHQRGLLGLAACAVEPNAFVAAKGAQAKFATHRQVSCIELVARKYDACKLDPETGGGGPRSLEVGAKGLNISPLFQAVEMREGMRADLLGRVVENPLDER